ncbi:hypothetical protein GCM10023340_33410 [Nocardioides marinquilinus]|uniref:DUF985 domain-containing protein n=1 Tax=Nocardioides marinquilinus TaxID=1210400 RepID=A0ABP9PY76_9ACTN
MRLLWTLTGAGLLLAAWLFWSSPTVDFDGAGVDDEATVPCEPLGPTPRGDGEAPFRYAGDLLTPEQSSIASDWVEAETRNSDDPDAERRLIETSVLAACEDARTDRQTELGLVALLVTGSGVVLATRLLAGAPAGPRRQRDDGGYTVAETLALEPHPEGGSYRRTWASPVTVTLPDGRERPTATLIWFSLAAGEASAWHRVASDELWLAHAGRVVLELGGDGEAPEPGERVVLDADDLTHVGAAQALVPADTWQRTVPTDADALVRCLVSPGFDFDDFELA